jgi:hypothetical protein
MKIVALLTVALWLASLGSTEAAFPARGQYLTSTTGSSCTAGAIDLSLTTGCNLPQYLGGIFP